MKKIILELDNETKRVTVVIVRYPDDNIEHWKRSSYRATRSSAKRVDSLFVRLGLDYAINYDGKFYMATNAVERIEMEPTIEPESAMECPDDER